MSEQAFIRDLREIVGGSNVLASSVDLQLYQYDGYLEEHRPEAVVFVQSTEEVARVVQCCNHHGKPFVPRGGGTNLTGGTIPFGGGAVIEMIRMNRLLEIDVPNLRARVQPGMFNLELGSALAPLGYQFIPDLLRVELGYLNVYVRRPNNPDNGGDLMSHVALLQVYTGWR